MDDIALAHVINSREAEEKEQISCSFSFFHLYRTTYITSWEGLSEIVLLQTESGGLPE